MVIESCVAVSLLEETETVNGGRVKVGMMDSGTISILG